MKVSGVIFDMDGLMVNTEPLYQVAWQQAARENGYEINESLYASFVGRPTQACESILLEAFGSTFPLQEFQQRWPVLWREEVTRVGVAVKPGLVELLDDVEARGLPSAV